jgi:hypothetical protein
MDTQNSRGNATTEVTPHECGKEGDAKHYYDISQDSNTQLEIWRPVQHHEDEIEVSNLGRVAAVAIDPETGETMRTIIKPDANPCGYFYFMEPAGKPIRHYLFVHEEVAAAFTPPVNEVGVLHLDGNKENNHASNLIWTNDIEERDYFDCGCSEQEMEEFSAHIRERSKRDGH